MGKRTTPFNEKHLKMYPMRIVTRDAKNVVTAVECLMCLYDGRETPEDAKRRRTENVQMWKSPFRKDLYDKHFETVHPVAWAKYAAQSAASKISYIDGRVRKSKKRQLDAFFEKPDECLEFIISAPIVDDLIAGLFFNPDDDHEDDSDYDESDAITLKNAMKLFKKQDDGDDYIIKIPNPLRFSLAVQHTSLGLSFRQTAGVIQQHCKATKNAKLGASMTIWSVSSSAFWLLPICK